MRKVELRMNEQRKYEEIKNLVDHGGNKKRVALNKTSKSSNNYL